MKKKRIICILQSIKNEYSKCFHIVSDRGENEHQSRPYLVTTEMIKCANCTNVGITKINYIAQIKRTLIVSCLLAPLRLWLSPFVMIHFKTATPEVSI